MKRIYSAVLARLLLTLVVAATLSGCAGSKPSSRGDAARLPRLTAFEVTPGNRSLLLKWNVERTPGSIFSGYNIYILEQAPGPGLLSADALARLVPLNETPFPGDTDGDPTHEIFRAESLENGIRYYCLVCAVGTQGELGIPTSQVMSVCRTGGTVTIEPMFKGDRDGYDFSAPGYVDADAAECDIAMYIKNGEPRIMSASRIDSLLRKTLFWDAGLQDQFDGWSEFTTTGSGDIELVAREHHIYVFLTHDGNYGKLRVSHIARSSEPTTIEFEYMHQSIPHLMLLR